MAKKETLPSEKLKAFLDFVDATIKEYNYASDEVEKEDKKVQTFLHALENSDSKEKNKLATKLKQSRKYRREMKDLTIKNQALCEFFLEPKNWDTINRLRQTLGKQRKNERYVLDDNRTFKKAVQI